MSEFQSTPNPEHDLPSVEFATAAQVMSSYAQLASLYKAVRNPLFQDALSKSQFSASLNENQAHYRFSRGRAVGDEYHSLDIREEGDNVTFKQIHALPLEHGKHMAVRDVILQRDGRVTASAQQSYILDRPSFLRAAEVVEGSYRSKSYEGRVPASFLDDAQQFIDGVWAAPGSAVMARIIGQ